MQCSLFVIICVSSLYLILAEQSRIIGGSKAEEHYPYQVSIQVKADIFFFISYQEWTHNCGGSILSENWVITAAHCLHGYFPSNLTIVTGTENLGSKEGVRQLIEYFVIHEEYQELKSNDIALIKMMKPIIFNEKTMPILFDDVWVGAGVILRLTGWGYKIPIRIGKTSSDLQEIDLPTISNEDCQQRGMNATMNEICTLDRLGKGACGGDSGGPLARNGVLVGIVSYGTAFCSVGVPDVHTRVSQFKDWIVKIMSE